MTKRNSPSSTCGYEPISGSVPIQPKDLGRYGLEAIAGPPDVYRRPDAYDASQLGYM